MSPRGRRAPSGSGRVDQRPPRPHHRPRPRDRFRRLAGPKCCGAGPRAPPRALGRTEAQPRVDGRGAGHSRRDPSAQSEQVARRRSARRRTAARQRVVPVLIGAAASMRDRTAPMVAEAGGASAPGGSANGTQPSPTPRIAAGGGSCSTVRAAPLDPAGTAPNLWPRTAQQGGPSWATSAGFSGYRLARVAMPATHRE